MSCEDLSGHGIAKSKGQGARGLSGDGFFLLHCDGKSSKPHRGDMSVAWDKEKHF